MNEKEKIKKTIVNKDSKMKMPIGAITALGLIAVVAIGLTQSDYGTHLIYGDASEDNAPVLRSDIEWANPLGFKIQDDIIIDNLTNDSDQVGVILSYTKDLVLNETLSGNYENKDKDDTGNKNKGKEDGFYNPILKDKK